MQIRQRRIAAGLTQEELGARLGVVRSMVDGWEKERYLPLARQLPALAKALDCRIEALFTEENARENEEGSTG